MSVAVVSRVLNSISTMPGRRRRALALVSAVVSAGLIALAVMTAGVTGLGFALAVIAVTAAAILWLGLRDAERRNAALTAELAVLAAAAGPVAASGSTQVTDGIPETIPAPVTEPQVSGETGETAAMSTDPVGGDGVVPVANDHEQTAAMEMEAAIPDRLPAFSLSALSGATVWDTDLAGRASVMVFWRPGCDHCQRLTPELAAWESLQGPRLIVVAACDGPTAYRSGLPGLVLLDPGFTVGQALGAPGTPAALPLGADGRPSGPVVAGTTAVMTLLLDEMRAWGGGTAEADAVVLAMATTTDVTDEVIGADDDLHRTSADEDAEVIDVPAVTDVVAAGNEKVEVETATVAVAEEDAVTADAGDEPVAGIGSDPVGTEGAMAPTPTSEPESIEAAVALRRVGSFAAGSDQVADADDAPVRRAG